MKKLFFILLASLAMAACGGDNREANREETENYDNTTPTVTPEGPVDMENDTTGTEYMEMDSTAMDTESNVEPTE